MTPTPRILEKNSKQLASSISEEFPQNKQLAVQVLNEDSLFLPTIYTESEKLRCHTIP